jgi:hypothetical protein
MYEQKEGDVNILGGFFGGLGALGNSIVGGNTPDKGYTAVGSMSARSIKGP